MNRLLTYSVAALLAFAALATPLFGAEEEAVAPLGVEQAPEELAPPVPMVVMSKSSEAGRYQLFEGQYSIAPARAGEVPERQLFRIDTVTGEVWIGKQVQFTDKKSNRLVQQRYWEPFEQYLTAAPERPRP